MHNEANSIEQHFFQKDGHQVSDDDLQNFVSRYPYVAAARFLLAKRKYSPDNGEIDPAIVTAGLYFNNPLWFRSQLDNENKPEEDLAPDDQSDSSTSIAQLSGQQQKTDEESPIIFQSYHTIDYFASQGIRLQQADLTRDRLGQQLKSFTEWLRSMKKLPSVEGGSSGPEDETRQQAVIQNAATSIEEKEVVTEAMAEVWEKQGNHARAVEIYHKLSLQNPAKSAYFAGKIDQLK
jgi:hypothetical protein